MALKKRLLNFSIKFFSLGRRDQGRIMYSIKWWVINHENRKK